MRLTAPITALLLSCAACAQGEDPRPNILLITLDTTRADRLGCYGWEDARTPHLDALAQRGARFELALSTAGITPMAHASILTGLNPYNHGLRVFHGDLSHTLADPIPTLAESLSAAGYDTAGFVSAYPLSPDYGLDQGFATYSTGIEDTQSSIDLTLPVRSLRENLLLDAPRSRVQRRADATTDETLDWLEHRDPAKPWFAWVHYFDVHDLSLVPPLEFAKTHSLDYDEAPHQRDLAGREAFYDMELAWMDTQLGRILNALDEQGQLDNTLVVLTADHGQGLSDGQRLHGWSRHRLIYQWSIHVPLLIAGPDISGPATIQALVRTTDIAPTILDLLNLAPDGPMDGASLLPLLRDEPSPPRIAYADALNTHDTHAPLQRLPANCRDDLHAVQDGHYKLIHHGNDPAASELYDLKADPEEQHNLFPAQPELAAPLRAWLRANQALALVPATAQTPDPNSAALSALGYTGEDPPVSDGSETPPEPDAAKRTTED
jgi:arylsulfatase A-like enzyme